MENSTLVDKQGEQFKKIISYEYIRGLIEGEGCFTFYPGSKKADGRKYKLPTFVIEMHERDNDLLMLVKATLRLRNKIYYRDNQKKSLKDAINHGNTVAIIVREFDQLKDTIVPLFYKKLHGHKGRQFMNWLEKIGNDPDISDRFKSLYRLYKWGIYDQEKFINKFLD